MTRKLIAMLLCVMMIASIITIPVFADEISYADYVPGEKPENMLKSAQQFCDEKEIALNYSQWWAAVGTIKDGAGMASRDQTNGYKGTYLLAKGTPGGEMTGTAGDWYQLPAGIYLGQGVINSNIEGGLAGDIDDGKNYVYAMQVRNLDAAYTPNIRFLLYDLDGPEGLNAKEWGTAGMPVTSTEWMDFKGSIAAPERDKADGVNDMDRISIGYNANTIAGSKVEINFNDESEGMYRMYFAEEAAYDITNELTSASSIITSKTPATFKAQILNQVGLPGNLNQGTFEWKAMDTDRTAEIPGITITANGGDATVTVDDTVAPGKYTIVAYNSTYDMAKGYTITVDTPSQYLDYTPGAMPANLIQKKDGTVYDLQYFSTNDGNNAKVSVSFNSWKENYFSVLPKLTYDGTTKLGRVQTYYQPGAWTNTTILPAAKMLQDETYVVRFKARNRDGNPANARVNFAALNFKNYSTLDYTKEYGIDGMELTGSDWQWFKGTLHIKPETVSNVAARFQIGLSVNALAGVGVDIWHNYKDPTAEDAVYIAYEEAYDITNKIVEGSDTFRAGKSATFQAQVVNQIGLPGYLDQNFTWKVLDRATRKIELENVEITATGGTATLTTTRDTVPGEYVVVAYNEANQMAKGVNITIEAPNYYEDYVTGEMPENIFKFSEIQKDMYALQYCSVQQDSNSEKVAQKLAWANRTWGYESVAAYDGETVIGKVNKGSRIPGGEMREQVMTGQLENDKGYVLMFKARNRTDYPAKVNVAVFNRRIGGVYNYNTEYGADGFQLAEGKDWQWVKTSVYVEPTKPAYATGLHPLLDIGLSETSLTGTGMDIYFNEEFYLAEEVAYDITNTATDTTAIANGAQAEFTAQVVNQIGLPGNLEQNIEWRVMNKARTADVDGFVITTGEDGTATIKVNGAAPGTYDVVAYNAENKMARGVEITVLAEEVTTITVDTLAEGKATLTALNVANTAAKDILVVVASYTTVDTAKKVENAAKAVLEVVDGAASLEESLEIIANPGNEIRVFAWDYATLAPIKLAQDVVASFTK